MYYYKIVVIYNCILRFYSAPIPTKLGSSSKLSININTIYFVESIILDLSKGNFALT